MNNTKHMRHRYEGQNMGKTSNESKKIWNKAHYTPLYLSSLPHELYERLKSKCEAEGISKSSFVIEAIEQSLGIEEQHPTRRAPKKKAATRALSRRDQRKRAFDSYVEGIRELYEIEQTGLDKVPEELTETDNIVKKAETRDRLEAILEAIDEDNVY